VRPLEVRRCGVVSYAESLEMQKSLVEERRAERVPDLLLLLRHPPVITLGVRATSRSHIVATDARLEQLGIGVYDTGRGGDVTYHGPGQVVGYPIMDLRPDRCDVHRYVRDIEEVMIRVCVDYGLQAERIAGLTGVWVGAEKVGAIGIRISRWVTSHGFALNVSTDLSYFDLVVPCGIADRGVTSLAKLTGNDVPLVEVEDRIIHHVSSVFDRRVVSAAVSESR
jgi:lipoyl(octanoyl) transferase